MTTLARPGTGSWKLSAKYAAQLLNECGEAEAAHDRLLAWSVSLAENADNRRWGLEVSAWSDRLELEVDNLRVALRWAQTRGYAKLGMSLATYTGWFWAARGYVTEGRRWLDALLGLPGLVSGPVKVKALVAAGNLAHLQGDLATALPLDDSAVSLRREASDEAVLGWALRHLGHAQLAAGRFVDAPANLEEAKMLGEQTREQRVLETVLMSLSELEAVVDNRGLAKQYAEQCIALCKTSGNLRTLGTALSLLAGNEWAEANYETARHLLEEGLQCARREGNVQGVSRSLSDIGSCLLAQGDFEGARWYIQQGLGLANPDEFYTAYQLNDLAEAHFAGGDYAAAASVLEKAAAQSAARGMPMYLLNCQRRCNEGTSLWPKATRLQPWRSITKH